MSDTNQAAADTTTATAGADQSAATAGAATGATPDATQDAAGQSSTILGEAGKPEAGADKPSEGDKADADESGAPAEYGDFTIPEGFEVAEDALAQFKEVAKANGLTQDAAQQLLNLHTSILQSQAEAYAAQRAEWAALVKADPEIGGPKFQDTVAACRAAWQKFGSPELLQFLEDSGLGNFPPLVKAFAKVGMAVREAGFTPQRGAAAPDPEKALLTKLYPTMFPDEQG